VADVGGAGVDVSLDAVDALGAALGADAPEHAVTAASEIATSTVHRAVRIDTASAAALLAAMLDGRLAAMFGWAACRNVGWAACRNVGCAACRNARAGVRVGGVTTFPGFSDRAVAFYAELAANNTREFWTAHKAVYESEVRDPMRALVADLESEFGPAKLFRPHRDIRFSNDKTPYKTQQGALAGDDSGVGYYVKLDSDGLTAGGGFRAHSSAQVARYRSAVDAEATGVELSDVVAGLRADGFDIEGEELKTKPRGYAADHPRIELLRCRSVMAFKEFGTPAWLASPAAFDQVRNAWRQVTPLRQWVAANVGPA
jgi:uncharacterized protein (TIGR02453 family)